MERIESLYKKRGYFERFGTDVIITILLICITVGITSYSTYTSIISQVKTNWNVNRCKPIFMPFAGIIMPQPGQTYSETTSQNFQYCIQQDSSMVINIALMPFEFAMFIVIEFSVCFIITNFTHELCVGMFFALRLLIFFIFIYISFFLTRISLSLNSSFS